MNLIKYMAARGQQHIFTTEHDTSGSISKQYTGIFGTFTGRSMSFGVGSGTLDGRLLSSINNKRTYD